MKKILILSNNALSNSRNNGKTLASIFSLLKEYEIVQLYLRDEYPECALAKSYFRLSDFDMLKNALGIDSGAKIILSQDPQKLQIPENRTSIFALCSQYLKSTTIGLYLRDFIWKRGMHNLSRLEEWLKSEAPDLIFFVGGGGLFSYKLLRHISDLLKIDFLVYFTDDYFKYYNRSWGYHFYRKRLIQEARGAVSLSKACFGIGEQMAMEYSDFFEKKFSWIMNCTQLQIPRKSTPSSKLVFSFFGGLHLNRWQNLARLGLLLKKLTTESGLESELNIYTITLPSKKILTALKKSGCTFRGGCIGKDLIKKIEETDVLIHVESEIKATVQMTMLSVSTKITEYLSSNRVLLGLGPTQVASMQLIKKYDMGLILDSSLSDNELIKELHVLWDEKIRTHFISNATKYTKNFMRAEIVKEKIKLAIEDCSHHEYLQNK